MKTSTRLCKYQLDGSDLNSKMAKVNHFINTNYETQRQQKYKLFINQSTYKAGGLMQAY